MANPATLANNQTAGGTRQGTQQRGGDGRATVPVVPFIRASAEHREPTGIDVTRQITGSDQDLGVHDIPAYGYVRSIVLVITASGGDAGAATVAGAGDAPWNAIKNIALTEPNGAVINQFTTGYGLYLANKWGGFRNAVGADPKSSPTFTNISSAGNFAFLVRIPVELNMRDGLGSLPNQNAAATFKLRMSLARSGDVYTTAPATRLPDVRVRAYLEAWDQPEVQSSGQTNQVTPPAMNTTQFWTEQEFNVSAGNQTIRLTRVGNYIRNLIFVLRRGGTDRVGGHTDLPDPLTFYLDTRPLDIISRENFLNQMYERTGFGAGVANDAARGLDSGVFVYDFTHEFDGLLGMENRDLWLPTLGSTRLELQGNFANAGRLTVLTNDVAIAGSVFI